MLLVKLTLGGLVISMAWMFLKKLMFIHKDFNISSSVILDISKEDTSKWNTGDIILQDLLKHKSISKRLLERLAILTSGCNFVHTHMVIKDEITQQIGLLGFGFEINTKHINGISEIDTIDKKWKIRSLNTVVKPSEQLVRIPVLKNITPLMIRNALQMFGNKNYAKTFVVRQLLWNYHLTDKNKFICSSAILKLIEYLNLADFSSIPNINSCYGSQIVKNEIFQCFGGNYGNPIFFKNDLC